MQATDRLHRNGCPTGSAVITEAGDLPAKYVIHAVGPVWHGGQHQEAELLASAYQRCLELSVEHACGSLAMPSLSTGAYRFPMERAADVAVATVSRFLRQQGEPKLVRFVLWDGVAFAAFRQTLANSEA